MSKNKAAQELGRLGGKKRWEGVPAKVRSELMRKVRLGGMLYPARKKNLKK